MISPLSSGCENPRITLVWESRMLRLCIPTLWVLFLVLKCVPDSAISTSWVTSRPHLAQALAGSTPQFHCEISDNPQVHEVLDLKLPAIDKIVTVESPKEILTNGLPYSVNGYLFPVKLVKLGDDDGLYDTTITMGNNETLFDCKVDPPYVGFAKLWLDPITLKLCCIFFPHFPEKLVNTAPPDSADIWRGLNISIHASFLKDNRISGSASALFVGGFSLLNMELNLTPYPDIGGNVTIVGNPNIEINWHHLDMLSITLVGGSKERGHVVYEVNARQDETFKDEVIISLPATGQRMELIVSHESQLVLGVIDIKLALFLLSLALVFLMYVVFQLQLQLQSYPRTVRRWCYQCGTKHCHTPRAFIESTTIDETPFYRQDYFLGDAS